MEKFINEKRINNTWAIIPISDLPDDLPVLAVSQFGSKSMAEFHLTEYVLIPKELEDKFKKPKKKIIKPKIKVDFPKHHQPTKEKLDIKKKTKKTVPFDIALMKSKQAYRPDSNLDVPF